MRPAVEGTLVTVSSDDPAVDWEGSGVSGGEADGRKTTPAEAWALADPDGGPALKLKPLAGKAITEFRYRLMTDLEYTELMQYVGATSADMMLLAIHAYRLCVLSVKRGDKTLDPDADISRKHKYNVGLRVWRASQLSEQDRDF